MTALGICGLAGSGKDTVASYISKDYGYVHIALADPLKRFVRQVWNYTDKQMWGASDFRNAKAMPDWDAVTAQFHHYYKAWLAELTQDSAGTVHQAQLLEWYVDFKDKCFHLAKGETSPRIVLQSLGTEWGRETYFENVWIDYALNVVMPKVIQPAYVYEKSQGLLKQSAPPGVVISDIRFRNEIEQLSKRGGKIVKLDRKVLDDVGEPGITNHKSEREQRSMEPELFDCLLSNNGTIEDLHSSIDVFMSVVQH